MKVIFVNRYYYPDESATSRMVASLAKGLVQRGQTPVIALTGRAYHDDPKRTLPKRDVIDGVEVRRIWSTRFGRGGLLGRAADYATFHISLMWELLCVSRRGDVCVLCTDPPLLSVSAMLPTALTGAKRVNWIMDLFPEVAIDLGLLKRGGVIARSIQKLRDYSFSQANNNVVPMSRMEDFLTSRGIAEDRIAIVHHWSDGDAIRPIQSQDSTLRKEWNLEGKLVIGYSGNMGRAHEFDTVIDAAKRLAHRKDIVFLFVGGGYHRKRVEDEVRRLGLPNVIMKSLQPREKLADSLAASDVHLVSLLPDMEAYIVPSKLYGIAAAGRPTIFIGDSEGEVARTISRGDCGVTISIGDGARLEQVILDLAASEPRRRAMGERARALFEAEFVEARGHADWVRLLREVGSLPARALSIRYRRAAGQ
jgi:glycosyltransferase involved in cell wall biosynthesis